MEGRHPPDIGPSATVNDVTGEGRSEFDSMGSPAAWLALMLHLVTFGGLALESVDEAVAPRLSAQRLAILAVLAAEGDRRVSRERLTGLFWPEADEEHARHSLRQAMYTLRHEVGREIVQSDFALSLDASAITADTIEFRAALGRGDRAAAAALVRGPFLAGFYLPSAAPFQRWVEEERARLHTAATGAIVSLATEASAANDGDAAVRWWRQLTHLDPLSGRFALGYLEALAARGDRAEALDFARHHAALVRRELETGPDAEIQRVEGALRSLPVSPSSEASPGAEPARRPTAARAEGDAPPAAPSAAGLRAARRRRLTHIVLVASAVAAVGFAGRVLVRDTPVRRADVTTRSATAYRLFEEGVRAYYRFDFAVAGRMMRAALEDDSTFAMAAYYDALLTDSPASSAPTDRAIRLAARASERERLVITVDLLSYILGSPRALPIADTLATRYPDDARALAAVARARQFAGDWQGAVRALEHAIAIDSATLAPESPCFLCQDLAALTDVYFWSDSLPAAARTAQRYARLRPDWTRPWELVTWAAAKMGDSVAAREALRRWTSINPNPRNPILETRINLLLDRYESIEQDLRPLLESPKRDDFNEARWWLLITLRNQGRLRDARLLNETGMLPGSAPPAVSPVSREAINAGLLALESGDSRTGAARFVLGWQEPLSTGLSPGVVARYHAWRGTLAGMAIAATRDTDALRRMADTVEFWGERSIFGRDRKAHHYLRGLLFVAAGRDDDAIGELQGAIHSPTLGFTRVNLELGRALLRRNRAREAVAAVAPALRGEVDASNLYVTRTELHELLAQAYDKAGEPDSAAIHYRAVVRAWANADEAFHARRDAARAWLARAKN
jgi:DNA-binding SARP family transcriptional activator